jgi:hypothetical protein
MTCSDCDFCIILEDNKPHCRRYPQQPLGQLNHFLNGQQNAQLIVDYPPLNRMDACGEWRAKNESV